MSGNNGPYAIRRRKKPVQKTVKPPPAKTNPSKRHRDRLNVELDHLASLLPFSEEIRSRLDKLSVLRLSVGYLKAKSCLQAPLQKSSASLPPSNGRNGNVASLGGVGFSEGELLLKALDGFVLAVMADGMVFYASPTIQDFLGFHQSDVVQQSVYNLVHTDDREMFRRQLQFSGGADSDLKAESGSCSNDPVSLLPQNTAPENSSFLERSFCCRLRCLLDNTSGFLALNFTGRLKRLSLLGTRGADGGTAALFAIATPVEPPSITEIRTKTFIFQTKHRMDFAPMGIDTRGKLVLGYSETELVTRGSGYQFIHAADMMYCADNHLKMMKTGNSGFTFFRLLTKTGCWLWVQASARVVFKNGRPDFIIARQKALTNEEGEEHLHQRRRQLPFNLSTGDGVLYDTWMEPFSLPGPPASDAASVTKPAAVDSLDPASLLGSLHRQDRSVYSCAPKPPPQRFPQRPEELDSEPPQSPLEQAFWDSHALLSVPGQSQAPQRRPVAGDQTAEAMIESLEQIMRDIGDGGMEDFEIEEPELRDWENTLVQKNHERQDAANLLNQALANDVFSYVEEALMRETRGPLQSSGLPETARTLTPTQNSQPWPPGGCVPPQGRPMIPSQPCGVFQPDSLQQSWHLPVEHANSIDHQAQHHLKRAINTHGLQGSSSCRQQQPPSFRPSAAAPPHHLLIQQLSGSCDHGNRNGHSGDAAAASLCMNWTLPGAACSGGRRLAAPTTPNCPFTLSHPHAAACPEVDNIGSLHLHGDSGGLEVAPSEYLYRNASLQPSCCWQEEARIPTVPLNGVPDPLSFTVHPTECVGLSQDTGM
ncbi:aryl hydrocarbon receptor-like [Takifugu flavidus]|uniref:Aryl hydrocarbon receptor n=1 Tax=Takifugu flavidus TaxID=433684 RepID=A0A5C6NKS2_9TELE|nr:aryl hydrocarbon receptor-like [Takifugu flavidus]TWW66257.1 Aryl hydrocarbon receptor [Takifugu flavidus]